MPLALNENHSFAVFFCFSEL